MRLQTNQVVYGFIKRGCYTPERRQCKKLHEDKAREHQRTIGFICGGNLHLQHDGCLSVRGAAKRSKWWIIGGGSNN